MSYFSELEGHYRSFWRARPSLRDSTEGRRSALPPEYRVLEFPPTADRALWIYATCCLWRPGRRPLELHLLSPERYDPHVMILSAIGDYHNTGAELGLAHTVNFGQPWMPGSRCTYGLISLPYLYGSDLDEFTSSDGTEVRCLWQIPITHEERDYKMKHSLEALEELFESKGLSYSDPMRPSVA